MVSASKLAEWVDVLARRGAQRLATWSEGDDAVVTTIPDLLEFLTEQHRRPSPPSIYEQTPMSLADRRAYHGFLTRPIARQAMLVVVPEYDRVARVLAKPVRSGLRALACGSLLQNYALAIAIARLMESPVEQAAAVLMASDGDGSERVRAALASWPRALRRRIAAHYRRRHDDRNACRRTATSPPSVSKIPSRSVSQISNRSLKNHAPDGRRALSLKNPGRPTD
jgi:hypothetical protein